MRPPNLLHFPFDHNFISSPEELGKNTYPLNDRLHDWINDMCPRLCEHASQTLCGEIGVDMIDQWAQELLEEHLFQ